MSTKRVEDLGAPFSLWGVSSALATGARGTTAKSLLKTPSEKRAQELEFPLNCRASNGTSRRVHDMIPAVGRLRSDAGLTGAGSSARRRHQT